MSSLQNILNPEEKGKRSVKLIVNTVPPREHHASPSDMPSSPASDFSANTNVEAGENPAAYDHEPHPDCPDTLACLPDTDGRPQHTLPVILRCAILGSPRRRLTIREIYAAMEKKYAYYKTAGPTWKQSVRHHLSLNRLFERQPRPVTDPGFGSYWTVNLAAPPGTKRPRKRGRPNAGIVIVEHGAAGKKRGRPRKVVEPHPGEGVMLPAAVPEGDEDDEDMNTFDGQPHSDDELDSEEEVLHPLDRRGSLPGLSHLTAGPSSASSSSNLVRYTTMGDPSESYIQRLQLEVDGLKRQSADAVTLSLRLSDQLAESRAEIARTKAALRSTEIMLEDESRKRRDAEREANEERRRRRGAEEALAATQRLSLSS